MQLVLITGTPLVQWALPEQVPCDKRNNSAVTAAPQDCACLPRAPVSVVRVGQCAPSEGSQTAKGVRKGTANDLCLIRAMCSGFFIHWDLCLSYSVSEGGE